VSAIQEKINQLQQELIKTRSQLIEAQKQIIVRVPSLEYFLAGELVSH